MIDHLLYLTISRSDIMFHVCLYAKFQSCPKESHLNVVKGTLKCLEGTTDLWLWYVNCDSLDLIGFLEVDFVSRKIDRKTLVVHVTF